MRLTTACRANSRRTDRDVRGALTGVLVGFEALDLQRSGQIFLQKLDPLAGGRVSVHPALYKPESDDHRHGREEQEDQNEFAHARLSTKLLRTLNRSNDQDRGRI